MLELLLRNELAIGPVPGLTLERGEDLLKGRRKSNGTVIKQAADLNASVDARTLFLGIPAVAIGTDIDATGRVLTGHQVSRFAGIIGDLKHDRCITENTNLFLAKIKIPALFRQKKCRNIRGQKFICEQFDPSQCTCDLVSREVGSIWGYFKSSPNR